ncbi:MAG: helix-turn-helix domain-containing protein [Candidatus Micrarchaeota archaeon]
MGKRIKHLRISIHHQDCVTCLASEKFPEIRLEQASQPICLKKKDNQLHYQVLYRLQAPNTPELDEYIKALRNSKDVIELHVLRKEGTEAIIMPVVRAPNLSYDTFLKHNVICSSPVVTEKGYERYDAISTDPNQLKKMLEELSDIGQMKILRIADYEKIEKEVKLTRKQEEALNLALTHGYYRWPRKITLDDLASMQNISRRSFQERLRRAESHVFPHLLKKILKTNTNG